MLDVGIIMYQLTDNILVSQWKYKVRTYKVQNVINQISTYNKP